MKQKFANLSRALLAQSVDTTDTQFSVKNAVEIPSLSTGEFFIATVFTIGSDYGTNIEIVKVVQVDGNLWTVERGQEDTTAKEHPRDSRIELRLTAGALSNIYNDIDTKVDKVVGQGLSDSNYTQAEKDKLNSVADEATKNLPDVTLLARENHTGTQAINTVAGLQAALDAAAESGGISAEDTARLVAVEDTLPHKADLEGGKLALSQMPDIAAGRKTTVADEAARLALDVWPDLTIAYQLDDGSAYALDANDDPSVPASWSMLGSGIADGVGSFNSRTGNVLPQTGDYTAAQITETATKQFVTADQKAEWAAKETVVGAQAKATAAGQDAKEYADLTFIEKTQKGAADGVATLDATGKLPATQLKLKTINGEVIAGEGDLAIEVDPIPLSQTTGTSTTTAMSQKAVTDALATKASASTQVIAGTGLSGGGTLAANRTFSVNYGASAGTAAQGNDTRIVNAVPNTRTITAGTGLTGGGTLAANRTLSVNYGTAAGTAAQGNDSRLSNSREWTAATITQAEAEAGAATTRRAFTAQRVRQAIVAWFNGISGALGRTILTRTTAAQVRSDIGLGTAATTDNGVGFGQNIINSAVSGQRNISYSGTLLKNTTGSYNTAAGGNALTYNTTGNYNTAAGGNALLENTTGGFNTAAGYNALTKNTTGGYNTAAGGNALTNNTTGNYNTAAGYGALYGNKEYSNCGGFGNRSEVTASNQIQLGNAHTTVYAYGAVQNRSDARDKADVRDTVLGLDFINAIRPVDFKWDMREDYRVELGENPTEEQLEANKLANVQADGTHTRKRYHHGVIAQEVAAVVDTLGIDFGGFQDHSKTGGDDVLSIGYEEFIAPLIKAVQELSTRVNDLEGKVEQFESGK